MISVSFYTITKSLWALLRKQYIAVLAKVTKKIYPLEAWKPCSSHASVTEFSTSAKPQCSILNGPMLFGIIMHNLSIWMMKHLWQQYKLNERLWMRKNICITFLLRYVHYILTVYPFSTKLVLIIGCLLFMHAEVS